MANWWGDDDIDSGSDSDLYASDQETPAAKTSKVYLDESSSEEETSRVVKSKKDTRTDELHKVVVVIEKKVKINDWVSISDEWTNLEKLLTKSRSELDNGVPGFLLAALVSLDDFINTTAADKSAKKSMKPANFKSFTKMKQNFKKFLKSNEFNIEEKIAEYRENPAAFEGEEAPETTAKKDFWFDEEGFDDEEEEDDVVEESDESSSEEDTWTRGEKRDISYWFTPDKEKKKGPDKKTRRERTRRETTVAQDEETAESEATTGEAKKEEEEQWTQEKINKAIHKMLAKRGAKGYDRKAHLQQLEFFLSKSDGVHNQIAIKFHLINAHFDAHSTAHSTHIPLLSWKHVYNLLVEIFQALEASPSIRLIEDSEALADYTDKDGVVHLKPDITHGHLLYSVDRLHDEYVKMMQALDGHSQAYITYLRFELDLLRLLRLAQSFYSKKGQRGNAAMCAYRQLEHLYYKKQKDLDATVSRYASQTSSESPTGESVAEIQAREAESVVLKTPEVEMPQDIVTAVESLAREVYMHVVEDRHKRRAMLQHIYHLAVHDRYFEGRDMLLMSHLQEKIHRAKLHVQVLYNRVLVQLGLAAFRLGRIEEAHHALSEIASSGRTKELLAQGMVHRNYGDAPTAAEKEEKRRQIPYHMHISLDLIETAHLVTAMLLELPNLAQRFHREITGRKKRVISKSFKRAMEIYERQVFSGPPESTREHVIDAAINLGRGEWKAAVDRLFSLRAWSLIENADAVRANYEVKIREVALVTYVCQYLQFYRTIELPILSAMFSLEEGRTHAILSKLMSEGDLAASFEQPAGVVRVHPGHSDPTPLQRLALRFADKANAVLDAEPTLERQERRQGDEIRLDKYRQQAGPRSERRFRGDQGRTRRGVRR